MAYEEKPMSIQSIINRLEQTSTLDGTAIRVYGLSVQPVFATAFILHSFTTLGSGTTTGTWTTGLSQYKEVGIFADVTLVTGDTATVNIYIDSRLDGTNIVNVGRYSVITTAARSEMKLSKQTTIGEVTGLLTDAGAGTVRNIPWGNDLRARIIISGDTGTNTGRIWLQVIA